MNRLFKIATSVLLMGSLVFATTDANAQKRNNNGNKQKVNKQYDRYDRYDRDDRYDRNRKNVRYGNVYRGQRTNLPPGQAKKVYGGHATDYAPGQVKKRDNVHYDRRTRTVWDDIFGTRRR